MIDPSSTSRYDLAGETCVVTGGGSGIGRGIAEALGREGARVAVLDRDVAGARATLELVAAAGGDGVALACDIADQASVAAAHAGCGQALGAADVLVNCAGVTGQGPMETLSLDAWNRVIEINLTGFFLCSQAFGRDMLARGAGAIVHVSSIASLVASPYFGSYGVSKAGVCMLSRLLAAEWGPRGVRSNAVLPGMIDTPMSAPAYAAAPDFARGVTATIPAGRQGHPAEIAHVVLSLASPRASYVNGSEVLVDGGFAQTLMTIPFHTLGAAGGAPAA